MNDFAVFTIKSRFGIGLILLLMIILTVLGTQKVNTIDQTLAEITDVNSVKQRYAINFRGSVHDRAIAIRDIAIARSSNEVDDFVAEITLLEQFYDNSDKKMKSMLNSNTPFSDKEKHILSKIDEVQSQTLPLISQIILMKKQGKNVNEMVLEQARPAFIQWLKVINEFIDYQEKQNQTSTPEAREIAGNFQMLMFVFTGIALLISIFVGLFIERTLIKLLGGKPSEAKTALSKMDQGDLSDHIETKHENSMMASLAIMQQKIKDIVSDIMQVSTHLTDGVGELSHSSKRVSESAQLQADLTIEMANKLDLMRNNIDRVSQIAVTTKENSCVTANYAKQGREAIQASVDEMEVISTTVHNTVSQVKQLEQNTQQISGIASVISGISEQTNLLALNAAIEAARAGESGRGFAVVADEVRQLAQRTGEATSQIEKMINEVQAETEASVVAMESTQLPVQNGRNKVVEANQLLQSIETQAQHSLSEIEEVAIAVNEQVSSIAELATAMEQIKHASNQSIHCLSDNANATQALDGLALRLKNNVSFFNI